jgi:hypothetical protein
MGMSRLNILGWTLMAVGFVVWGYGYLFQGSPPVVNWPHLAPHWVAEFIPNVEAEIGLAVMALAMIPSYWKSNSA